MGLELQLIIYMNVSRGRYIIKKQRKEVTPAGVFSIYQLQDPIVKADHAEEREFGLKNFPYVLELAK